MSGLYIHIPFCKKACAYCDFHFSTSLKLKEQLVEALCLEIKNRGSYLLEKPLDSIYFGGGTPSLLSEKELADIINTIHQNFVIHKNVEFTLEANPDDIDKEKIVSLKKLGVNRLSIGIQSFYEDDLKWMNRSHDATQAESCIRIAQDYGITNLNLDLIYGYELLSLKKWEHNILKVLHSGAKHLSAYTLSIEPKTMLAHRQKTGQHVLCKEETMVSQWDLLSNLISENNWERYEISNYCNDEAYAKHNTGYWQGKSYLGIGPSAHSFNQQSRSKNIANNALYIDGIKNGKAIAEIEDLDDTIRYNEYIMTGLRTKWGVDLGEIENIGLHFKLHFKKELDKFQHLIEAQGETVRLNDKGMLISDNIIAALFY